MSPPRLRMFAGPNGSGKSTIKEKVSAINPSWLGVYINPDDIEREIASTGYLDFGHFKVKTHKDHILRFLRKSNQLINNDLVSEVSKLRFDNNSLSFHQVKLNSYVVSAIADFLHERLITSHTSFSFETVMSHPKKIEVFKNAQSEGFRNYLYFVATEGPEINLSRVQIRVKKGGHDVPPKKVVDRYFRTLDNLTAAIRVTNRAYIYDNSGAKATLIAEITEGKDIEIINSNIPTWVRKYVLEKST
jgi:predicted ABC-type ATPase